MMPPFSGFDGPPEPFYHSDSSKSSHKENRHRPIRNARSRESVRDTQTDGPLYEKRSEGPVHQNDFPDSSRRIRSQNSIHRIGSQEHMQPGHNSEESLYDDHTSNSAPSNGPSDADFAHGLEGMTYAENLNELLSDNVSEHSNAYGILEPTFNSDSTEHFYTNLEVEVLHDIILHAEQLMSTLTEEARVPSYALFQAYSQVIPRLGIDVNEDDCYAPVLFSIGALHDDRSIYDKFVEVMYNLGIQIQHGDEDAGAGLHGDNMGNHQAIGEQEFVNEHYSSASHSDTDGNYAPGERHKPDKPFTQRVFVGEQEVDSDDQDYEDEGDEFFESDEDFDDEEFIDDEEMIDHEQDGDSKQKTESGGVPSFPPNYAELLSKANAFNTRRQFKNCGFSLKPIPEVDSLIDGSLGGENENGGDDDGGVDGDDETDYDDEREPSLPMNYNELLEKANTFNTRRVAKSCRFLKPAAGNGEARGQAESIHIPMDQVRESDDSYRVKRLDEEVATLHRNHQLTLVFFTRWQLVYWTRRDWRKAAWRDAERLSTEYAYISTTRSIRESLKYRSSMDKKAERARFYLLAMSTLAAWKDAALEKKKERTREAMNGFIRKRKIDLTRKAQDSWRRKSRKVNEAYTWADEVRAERVEREQADTVQHWRLNLTNRRENEEGAQVLRQHGVYSSTNEAWIRELQEKKLAEDKAERRYFRQTVDVYSTRWKRLLGDHKGDEYKAGREADMHMRKDLRQVIKQWRQNAARKREERAKREEVLVAALSTGSRPTSERSLGSFSVEKRAWDGGNIHSFGGTGSRSWGSSDQD